MTPPTTWASKGREVEEAADLAFFRPAGYRIARALQPTRVTADRVTALSLVLGLVAGHLFVYRGPWVNTAGVLLFVISDVFDSADGQLARLRGTSTRAGRILDGLADSVRFTNLYLHLVIRLIGAGWGWGGVALAALAITSHSFQSAAVDFVRNAYLALGLGRAHELDLPETPGPFAGRWAPAAVGASLYAGYVRRQARLFPDTVLLLRALGGRRAPPEVAAAWRTRQAGALAATAWIGQNIRFLLLAVTAPFGWPAGFLWITAGPLNAVLVWLVLAHERNAARILAAGAEAPSHA